MELVLIMIAYLFQIGCTLIAAVIVCAPIVGVMGLRKVTFGKRRLLCIYLLVLLLLCAALAWLCYNPILLCPDEYEELFTEDMRQSVKNAANGLYSVWLPLIPFRVEVQSIRWIDSLQKYETIFEIEYLYIIGSVTMALGDGLSVIKPLSGL